jgi:23S rRNA pseudouridine2605 synthase
MEERLQKLIAQAGLASRRGAEELIEQGRVTVNGKVAILGQKGDPNRDTIRVDGRPLPKPERLRYFMLNKPRGVLSAVKSQSQLDRPTVVDLLETDAHVYPVGRLDLNSEGLVLLTNDGELANHITHPRYGHEKTYKVLVEGEISEDKLNRWRSGLTLPDGYRTGPIKVRLLERTRSGTWLRIVMSEGHKRQIRATGETLGHPVRRLIRTHIGPLAMGDLPPGHWRELTRDEVALLKKPPRGSKRRSKFSGGRSSGSRRPPEPGESS